MTVGRKPRPAHLRVLDGSAGSARHRRRVLAEPKAPGRLHEPPDWLTDGQKEGWRHALEHAPPGLLKPADRGVLVTWVVAEDAHRQAVTRLAEPGTGGLLATTGNGTLVASPLLGILNRQALIMIKAAGELGFTPVARARAAVDVARDPDDDPAEEFFA